RFSVLRCSCCDYRNLFSFPTRRSSDLGAINAAKAFARGWTATISVNNNATGPIQTALNMLRDLDGRVATSTIRTVIETVRTSKADRKSTRLNSSHVKISYAAFCWKKKN